MSRTNLLQIQRHIAVLQRGCVRGRQLVCKSSEQLTSVCARCSTRYCGKSVVLTFMYMRLETENGAEQWEVDVIPDPEPFADVPLNPLSLLTAEDLAAWESANPLCSLALFDVFLRRLSEQMLSQLKTVDDPR